MPFLPLWKRGEAQKKLVRCYMNFLFSVFFHFERFKFSWLVYAISYLFRGIWKKNYVVTRSLVYKVAGKARRRTPTKCLKRRKNLYWSETWIGHLNFKIPSSVGFLKKNDWVAECARETLNLISVVIAKLTKQIRTLFVPFGTFFYLKYLKGEKLLRRMLELFSNSDFSFSKIILKKKYVIFWSFVEDLDSLNTSGG